MVRLKASKASLICRTEPNYVPRISLDALYVRHEITFT